MTIMPGATWRPITIPGGTARRTSKGRAVILHVAVSESPSLFNFFNKNTSANSHFYVSKAGVIEQYVDTDYQSWASAAANPSTISVETQGGVTNPDGEPWTAAQIAALGRICAWAHVTEGVPLQPMPNSLPTSRGIGYHRLGIRPWVVAGGQIWSSSTGKLCPGAAKIAQIPQIIAAASGATPTPEVPDMDATQAQQLADVHSTLLRTFDAHGYVTSPADNTGHTLAIRNLVQQLADKVDTLEQTVASLQTGGVDPVEVARLVLAGLNGAQLNVQQAAGK